MKVPAPKASSKVAVTCKGEDGALLSQEKVPTTLLLACLNVCGLFHLAVHLVPCVAANDSTYFYE